MTTDELERDLKTLAEAKAGDEHLRRAIRASLHEELNVRPRSRSRTRLVLGVAATAAATVVAAIVVLGGTGGSGGPASANAAILAHVNRTMSPPADLIVHVKETGMNDGTPVSAEWWQETNAPHALRLMKGAAGYVGEGGSDGTTAYQYDAATNTIYEHPDSKLPTLVDPVETVRAALANGTAQVAGTVTIDGRSLYKIVLPNGVTGYFDQSNYRPVYLDNPQGNGSVVRTTVVAYDELPLTPENQKLLSVTAQHPDARVETSPAPVK
jgi:hypothetical protein